ncbi:MAG: hypothetical protein EOP45_21335 [Sphingobacteriaceae bacterium]|nr:MAG: hypothetical protein EOP45_21335 [Sphingobacteriaceae bacterium]
MISKKAVILGFVVVFVLIILIITMGSSKTAVLYNSVTLNIPNTSDGANFRNLQFFAGTTDVTSKATMSQNGVNGQDTPFVGSNIFVFGGAAATLTATFTTPQPITSVVYTPHPSFLCRSWGMTITTKTSANVTKTGSALHPSQCTSYSADPVDRGDASSFHYTYTFATDTWTST